MQGTGALCRMDMAGAGDMENMECVGSKGNMECAGNKGDMECAGSKGDMECVRNKGDMKYMGSMEGARDMEGSAGVWKVWRGKTVFLRF